MILKRACIEDSVVIDEYKEFGTLDIFQCSSIKG